MPKACGKLAEKLCLVSGKNCDRLSIVPTLSDIVPSLTGVKLRLLPRIFRHFTSSYSLSKSPISYLFEHYLYPVSTVPTIITTRLKN